MSEITDLKDENMVLRKTIHEMNNKEVNIKKQLKVENDTSEIIQKIQKGFSEEFKEMQSIIQNLETSN